jgi:hypothetical protein
MDDPVASFQGFGDDLKIKVFFRSGKPSDSGESGGEKEQNREIQ